MTTEATEGSKQPFRYQICINHEGTKSQRKTSATGTVPIYGPELVEGVEWTVPEAKPCIRISPTSEGIKILKRKGAKDAKISS